MGGFRSSQSARAAEIFPTGERFFSVKYSTGYRFGLSAQIASPSWFVRLVVASRTYVCAEMGVARISTRGESNDSKNIFQQALTN